MAIADMFRGYFGFREHGTDLRRELIAGLTTFLAMSYIIFVNPAILSVAIDPAGVSDARVFQNLVVVTILAAVAAMLVMAFYANRPFGLAPGMGLNAFFVTVVIGLGVPWQTALAAVFVEGVLFIVLTAIGAREYIIALFPDPVKYSVGAGIGLFLAIIGLQWMRINALDPDDLVTLNPALASDPVAVLAVVGVLVTFFLYVRGVRGAIVLGILITSILAYLAGALGYSPYAGPLPKEGQALATPVTLAPGAGSLTYGASAYDISPLLGAFVAGLQNVDILTFLFVMVTFFFVDFFDTAGTLTGLSQEAGFLDEEGNLPEMNKPLMADAIGTTVGGILGTSTVTTYIESSTGIEEGGRTGMVPLVVAVLFLLALAVVPVVGVIPSFAPYIALLIVAVFMFRNVNEIRWEDTTHAIPAAMTIAIMPLTHSIANGIAAGLITYPVVKAANGEWHEVSVGQWVMAIAFVAYYFIRTNVIL